MQCGIDNCTRSYENYASFRRHLKRKHPEAIESRREEHDTSPDESENEDLGGNEDTHDDGSSENFNYLDHG